jgi:hypothetical protein
MGEYIATTIPEQTAWNLIDEQSRLLAQMLAGFSDSTAFTQQELADGLHVPADTIASMVLYLVALDILIQTENTQQMPCFLLSERFRVFIKKL